LLSTDSRSRFDESSSSSSSSHSRSSLEPNHNRGSNPNPNPNPNPHPIASRDMASDTNRSHNNQVDSCNISAIAAERLVDDIDNKEKRIMRSQRRYDSSLGD
jgi:hypothetical protein